jgi:penicillin-binding protein 1A
MGFSTPRTLGTGETGGTAALPIWINYMGVALKGVPDQPMSPPEGITAARIDPATGLRDAGGGGISEFFYHENLPREHDAPAQGADARPQDDVKAQIF